MGRADELRRRHEAKSQKMGIGKPESGGQRSEDSSRNADEPRNTLNTRNLIVGLVVAGLLGAGILFGVRWQAQRDTAFHPQGQLATTGRSDLPEYITSVQSGAGQAVAPPRDGMVTIPTEDGGKGMVFQYRNGKLHGEQQVFAGHKRSLRIFHCVDGRMHGRDTFYDLKGRVRRVVLWENGASRGLIE